MASCSSYIVFEGTFVIKATTNDLTLLSKFLAWLQTQIRAEYVSRVYHNKTTNEYFAYVHVSNAEIAEKLQSVSFLPNDSEEVDQP